MDDLVEMSLLGVFCSVENYLHTNVVLYMATDHYFEAAQIWRLTHASELVEAVASQYQLHVRHSY